MKAPKRYPASLDSTAKLFGVDSRTVRRWITGGLPVISRGSPGRGRATTLDLAVVMRWYLKANPLKEARTRLASAQADRLEAENLARARELVSTELVPREWAKLARAVREKMLSIPAKVAPQLVNVRNASVIAERLTAAYAEAARDLTAHEARKLRRRRPESSIP